jgi:hypothetical protein
MSQAEATVVQKKGVITKCPSCNAPVAAGAAACPACGHEFAEVDANRTVRGLAQRLDEIDREVQQLGLGLSRRKQEAQDRKANAIRNYPIPNARDDLLQLIHFIHPRTQDGAQLDPNVVDWRVKFAEVMSRAKAAYAGESARLAEFERLEQSLDAGLSHGLKNKAARHPLFVGLLAVVLALGAFAWFNAHQEAARLARCEADYGTRAQAERERLEKVQAGITQDLQARRFPEAMAGATRMRWEQDAADCRGEDNQKAKALWDEKRTQLVALIQQGADTAAAEKQAAAEQQAAAKAAEENKEVELARVAAERERAAAAAEAARVQAAAAKAATQQRRAATEKLF